MRETECYSGERPYNLGLFHTGCGGGPTGAGERTIFGLNTAIQAVGEGNYGRLGAGQQQRYTDAEAEPMFGQPYTGGEPDEQPGSLPEILPSPDFDATGPNDANIERCWTCRAMFVQAWGHYGTVWPVVHQQLGVRPDLGRGAPGDRAAGAVVVADRGLEHPARLGRAAASSARRGRGSAYRTAVDTGDVRLQRLYVGHTLPRGTQVAKVRLDGRRAATGWSGPTAARRSW